MRLAIDMISAGDGFNTGAGAMVVYYEGLLRGASEHPEVESIVALVRPWDPGLAIPESEKVEVVPCGHLPRHRVGRVIYEHVALPILVKRANADILLSTCNTRPIGWRGPSVVVLQSLQYMYYPEIFGRLRTSYLKKAVPASLRSADAVIAVSEWERQEAIGLFDLDPSRIFTVRHGVPRAVNRAATGSDLSRLPAVGAKPYVVMVSTLYGFKNHARLVRAFAATVATQGLPHSLVIAGGDADVTRSELASLASELGIGDRVLLLGPVPHNDVPRLLVHADAVAYVSLYETFGLPVIEALALARPLVTSDVGAMAEIAGDCARLVDPSSVSSIAEGLADVLTREELRRDLERRGPKRAATFTLERCAQETVAVLQAVLARSDSG